jgi:hypothetical protein
MNLARTLRKLSCVAAGWAAVSCGGPGNTGRSTPPASLVEAVPWLNGVQPEVRDGEVVIPPTPEYPPIGLGLPDPGSHPVDCHVLDGLEFSTAWFDTFEPVPLDDPTQVGVASGWSSYDDLSQYAFHTPGDATWYPMLKGFFGALWGMPSDRIAGPGCDGTKDEWALRFRGGLFRKWGGGASHALTDPDPGLCGMSGPKPDICPPDPPAGATTDSAGLPLKAANGDDYRQSHGFVDVSSYDGVAFWARRGPEGADQVKVILTDKFTSGRLARENQTFCRRVRECHTTCLNQAPCSLDDSIATAPVWRCFDPKAGPLPVVAIDSLRDLLYPRCGASACTSPGTYSDPDFDTKQCLPYTFPAADESGEYCYNPGDLPPPSRDDRCQDGWNVTLQLSTDWKFYEVPFSEFLQGGFGKRAPYMDLKSIDTIAFAFNMGWADGYFDNVTFYRRKK